MRNDIQKLVESFEENSRIGDVLEKMKWLDSKEMIKRGLAELSRSHYYMLLLEKWTECGFTKSLQELAECEWHAEDPCKHPGKEHERACFRESEGRIVLVPKQKPIRELFQFLLQLNLAE